MRRNAYLSKGKVDLMELVSDFHDDLKTTVVLRSVLVVSYEIVVLVQMRAQQQTVEQSSTAESSLCDKRSSTRVFACDDCTQSVYTALALLCFTIFYVFFYNYLCCISIDSLN